MKVFITGNPLVRKDSLPLQLLPWLRKQFPNVKFREFDPTESLDILGRNPVIIDTIEGIDDFAVISDTDQIKSRKMFSLHDFDLGINLKLMKKLGTIESILIIGIPMNCKTKEAKDYLVKKISELNPVHIYD